MRSIVAATVLTELGGVVDADEQNGTIVLRGTPPGSRPSAALTPPPLAPPNGLRWDTTSDANSGAHCPEQPLQAIAFHPLWIPVQPGIRRWDTRYEVAPSRSERAFRERLSGFILSQAGDTLSLTESPRTAR